MSGRQSSSGYSLLLVIFAVAMLSLILLTVAQVQGDLGRGLARLRAEADYEVQAANLTARATFLLLTEPVGPRSLVVGGPRDPGAATGGAAELRLDGRLYAAAPGAFVSIQDEAGLFDLNSGDDVALAGLLSLAGVQRADAAQLAGALGDFIDSDDLTRPNGAERSVYLRAGEPAPMNRALTTRWAALDVWRWKRAFSHAGVVEFWDNVTVRPSGGVNVNTAPAPVLSALLGNERTARDLLAQREQTEIRAADEVEALTGIASRPDGAGLATSPGSAFRVLVAFGEETGARGGDYETQVVLADPDADRPFFWRERRRVRASEANERGNHPIEAFPNGAHIRGSP